MVNATKMVYTFPGKRTAEWLRPPSTEAFLSELEAMRKSHRSILPQTKNGAGTWMHEDLALEFARWLIHSFATWCNDRIKELLKTGTTAIQQQSDDDMILLSNHRQVCRMCSD